MVLGQPRHYERRYKFLVEIDGYAVAKFKSCSALEAELATIEINEGGAEYPEKEPGRVSFSDVTLERGATDDLDSYNWFKETVNAAANAGAVSPSFKRNVDVVAIDRDNTELKRWACNSAWPKKFVAGDWDNDADEVTVEQLVLAFNFFELVQ
jgi:phage tail-like protein